MGLDPGDVPLWRSAPFYWGVEFAKLEESTLIPEGAGRENSLREPIN